MELSDSPAPYKLVLHDNAGEYIKYAYLLPLYLFYLVLLKLEESVCLNLCHFPHMTEFYTSCVLII